MPRFIFDLGDLWQDIKNTAKENYMLWTDPREAPPVMRRITIAHIPLKDLQGNHVGTFVPELYELAKIGGLIAQEEESAWLAQNPNATIQEKQNQPFYAALYHANGDKKTAFELAVLPVIYEDGNQLASDKVRELVKPEINNRIQKNLSLPPVVYKYLTKNAYLKRLNLINLQAMGPRDVTIEIQNPAAQTRIPDRIVHYMAQRTSLLLTMIVILSVTAATPMGLLLAGVGALLAEWCGKEFGTFGIGEILLRDLKSVFNNDFGWGNGISVKKAFKGLFLLSAVSMITLAAVSASWGAVIALPVWGLAQTGMAATAVAALSYAVAGFAAAVGGMMTFLGAKEAIHFFWGFFDISDRSVDFTRERQLPVLTKTVEVDSDLLRAEKRLATDCKLAGHELNAQERNELHGYMAQLEAFMAQKLAASEHAAVPGQPTPVQTTEAVAQPAPTNVVAFDAARAAATQQASNDAVVAHEQQQSRHSPRLTATSSLANPD